MPGVVSSTVSRSLSRRVAINPLISAYIYCLGTLVSFPKSCLLGQPDTFIAGPHSRSAQGSKPRCGPTQQGAMVKAGAGH